MVGFCKVQSGGGWESVSEKLGGTGLKTTLDDLSLLPFTQNSYLESQASVLLTAKGDQAAKIAY